jgi:hypothetical protein
MADEMSDGPSARSIGTNEPCKRPVADMAAAMNELPTLQRNALRKIFDRPHFMPDEVAALGYRRLQQAEGIGTKGLAAITNWLKLHGHELQPPMLPTAKARAGPKKPTHHRNGRKTAAYAWLRGAADKQFQRERTSTPASIGAQRAELPRLQRIVPCLYEKWISFFIFIISAYNEPSVDFRAWMLQCSTVSTWAPNRSGNALEIES